MLKENESIQAVLFANKNRESAEARQILSDHNIIFRVVDSIRGDDSESIVIPTVLSSEGDFAGIERIKEFVEIVTERPKIK